MLMKWLNLFSVVAGIWSEGQFKQIGELNNLLLRGKFHEKILSTLNFVFQLSIC